MTRDSTIKKFSTEDSTLSFTYFTIMKSIMDALKRKESRNFLDDLSNLRIER